MLLVVGTVLVLFGVIGYQAWQRSPFVRDHGFSEGGTVNQVMSVWNAELPGQPYSTSSDVLGPGLVGVVFGGLFGLGWWRHRRVVGSLAGMSGHLNYGPAWRLP
ncbi:MAG TPA: hypothetical protein VME46_15315 [Acidimicrobiales bacterium]|nr:hypothetical protein [Acidimicrobiales bacterium]